jgi:hypothetical protein
MSERKAKAARRRIKSYTVEQADNIDKRIRKTCHPKQEAFCFDTASRISLLCGRGAGKTSAELMRMMRAMVRRDRANCIYVASTRDSVERIAWADLKRIVSALGMSDARFNETKLTLTLPNGSTLRLFGADDMSDIDKLRGVTWHEVAIDECASIKLEILSYLLDEVIGWRLVGAIVLLGTPGDRLDGLFYLASAPGTGEHRPYASRDLPEYANWIKWSSHAWSILDGVAAGITAMIELNEKQLEHIAKKGWTLTNPIVLREREGKWAADNTLNVYIYRAYDDDGKEFNQWTPRKNQLGYAILPDTFKDWGYGIGFDLGHVDKTAVEVFAFSYTDPARRLYHVYEVYRGGMYANALAKLLIGDALDLNKLGGIFGQIGWPDVMAADYAGHGGALMTELATVYGINVPAADKPYKYKDNAIALQNSALYERQIVVMKDSALATEMSTLQWVTDAQNKRVENSAQANHACDAALYLRNAVAPLLAPASGGDTSPPTSSRPAPPRPREDDEHGESQQQNYGDADSLYSQYDV